MNYIQSPFMVMSLFTMMVSTVMAMSSSNWLFIWAAMELNLMSFIPIILHTKASQECEGVVKYFIAQALGSALLISSSFLMWLPESALCNMSTPFLTISLMLKLGSFPCHFWYPSVMCSISWISCLILSTWQKIAPLGILSFFVLQKSPTMLVLIASMNALVGGIMGMNQSQLRAIMAYSSIGHMGWMIGLLTIMKPMLTFLYFMIYCLMISPLFMVFNSLNMKTTKNMSFMSSVNPLLLVIMFMLLMSLGGLPPLTGFFPKLMALYMLMEKNMMLLLILIAGSLMNLYFYLNIVINSMMMSPQMISTKYLQSFYVMSPATAILSLMLLGMTPFIFLMYAMTLLNKS